MSREWELPKRVQESGSQINGDREDNVKQMLGDECVTADLKSLGDYWSTEPGQDTMTVQNQK